MVLSLAACSYGLAQPKVIAGQWFPEAELVRVQRGASIADLRAIGGAPLEVLKTADGERWRYFMSMEGGENMKLLGIVPLPSRRSVRTFEVVFRVRDGLVADVTSRDTHGPR
jgi:hypothetical protein